MAVALIDVVAQVAAWCEKRPNVLAKAQALRTERTRSVATHEKTQERAQKKRDDKLAKEKEKKEKMSDEQLAKYEEKEHRRKMKKSAKTGGGRMKVIGSYCELLVGQLMNVYMLYCDAICIAAEIQWGAPRAVPLFVWVLQ